MSAPLSTSCPFCDMQLRGQECPADDALEIREACITIAYLCREIGPAGIEKLVGSACGHCSSFIKLTVGIESRLTRGGDA